MNISTEIKSRIKSLDRLKLQTIIDCNNAIPFFKRIPKELPDGISLSGYHTRIILYCESFDLLHEARTIMKKVFKKWEDKNPRVEHEYGTFCHVTYKDPTNNYGVIHVSCNMNNLPEEFTKNGCKWESHTYTSTSSNFVCPVKS
jgi:hypothetical protein